MKKRTLLAVLVTCFAASLALCACNEPDTPPNNPDDNPPIVQPETPTLSLATTTYDYADADLALTVTNLNKATTVTLKRGMDTIAADNYTLSEDTLTLKKSYLSTLAQGNYLYNLQSDIGNVAFTVRVPAPPAGEPSVTPKSAEYEIADLTDSISFEVNYNRGFFDSLTLGDKEVDDSGYSTTPSGISFNKEYLVSLGAGTHEFTLTTDGGTCTFSVKLTRNKLFIEASSYTVEEGENLQIPLYGTTGKKLTVTLGGAPLAETNYSVANDKLTLNTEYLDLLSKDVYCLEVSAGQETTKTYVVNGFAAGELFFVDFEAFAAPAGNSDYLALGAKADETHGVVGEISTQSNSTLFKTGDGNLNYTFEAGKTYEFSMDIKVPDEAKPASPTAFIIFLLKTKSGGSADIGHLRVSQSGYTPIKDPAGKSMDIVELGDGWYRYIVCFDWIADYNYLEVPYWNVSNCYLDNIKLHPVEGSGTLSVPADINFVTPRGAETNKVLSFGEDVTVLGVKLGDDWATDEVAIGGNQVTFLGTWLKTLEKAAEVEFTVYTNKCAVSGSVSVPSTDATLEGDSFRYLNDGADMTFALNAAGNTLAGIELDNYTAKTEEYALTGTTLTLKASLLNRISGTGALKVKFVGGGELTKELTSKRLFQVDFDDFGKTGGFSYINMSDELVTEGGINGNSGRFSTEQGAAGFVAFGGSFAPVEITAGIRYRFSMKIKVESLNKSVSSAFEGNMLMAIKFDGVAQDIAYIWNEGSGRETLTADGSGIMKSGSATLHDDGYYEIVFEFEPRIGDALPLQFETKVACTFLVDDIVLSEI